MLSLSFQIPIYGQIAADSNSVFYKKSISLVFRDLSFDQGLGGIFWINSNYSVVVLFNIYYSKWLSSSTATGNTYKKDIRIYPNFSIRRHLFQKENITPYVGITIQPTWFAGDNDRSTYLDTGVMFGVESWLTNNITVTGEQSYLYSRPINNSRSDESTYGKTSVIISFYF
jgi:hypothetical protein